jgi:ribosomal protein L10
MATEGADQALRTASSGAGLSGELRSVPQTAASITVNHDNVLQAAKIISDVLVNEGTAIEHDFQNLMVVPPGQDVVSRQAAAEWNAKVVTNPDSYQNRVQQYLQNLQQLADNLATTAKQYGYSEEEITAAFQGGPAGSASA